MTEQLSELKLAASTLLVELLGDRLKLLAAHLEL
jgi:hypothetical protein